MIFIIPKQGTEKTFTCVPLPEPGGPSRMALMPGSFPSSSGWSFSAVAKGGMMFVDG